MNCGIKMAFLFIITDLSRGTISVISFSLLISSSLQGAHKEPIVQIMNCESRPMSSTPFSACCWIKGRSRASSIREPRRLWSTGRKDSSVWTTEVKTVILVRNCIFNYKTKKFTFFKCRPNLYFMKVNY